MRDHILVKVWHDLLVLNCCGNDSDSTQLAAYDKATYETVLKMGEDFTCANCGRRYLLPKSIRAWRSLVDAVGRGETAHGLAMCGEFIYERLLQEAPPFRIRIMIRSVWAPVVDDERWIEGGL